MASTSLLLGLIIAAAASPSPQTWSLATADTRLEITVANQQPAIALLCGSADQDNWIDQPATIPLVSQAWEDGREAAIHWEFVDAQQGADTLTLRFEDAVKSLWLRSVWRAQPGAGPVEHWVEIENHSPRRLTLGHQESLALVGLQAGQETQLWWIRPLLHDVKVHHVLPRPDGVHWDGMFYWSPSTAATSCSGGTALDR